MSDFKHRLTGLRYPRHILRSDGTPYCGIELNDQHKRLLANSDPEDLTTVDELLEDHGLFAVTDYCGNCRPVYLTHVENADLQAAVDEYEAKLSAAQEGTA